MSRRARLVLVVLALASLSPGAPAPRRVGFAPAPTAEIAPPPVLPRALVAGVRQRLERYPTGLTRAEQEALADTIVRESWRHDLPVELVLAVMHVESRFHTFAVSPVGAVGLMQLLPSTAEEVADELGVPWRGARTLFDPEANVRLGVAYLKWLERRYGRLEVALAAYNWGPGRVDRRLRQGGPLPADYSRSVLQVYGSRRPS